MTTPNIVGRDTDGTPWVTVRCYIDVQVIAEDEHDAIYHAELLLLANYSEISTAENFEFIPLEVVQ